MFQKYEANPTGLIFGGIFALILAVFGLRSFNAYIMTATTIEAGEMVIVVLADLIGLLVAVLGIAMLVSGVLGHLSSKKKHAGEKEH